MISLFTNIPLDLAIDSIIKRRTMIEKNTTKFVSTINFILSSIYFTFNNVIYKQTFGMPIGTSLSLIIADVIARFRKESARFN